MDNLEEIRQKARTARENCLDPSKGEEYLNKQTELAKEQYNKLLELCPDDIEAKIFCAYYEAVEATNVKDQHKPAAEKMMKALDVFAEDLNVSSLPLEEREDLIRDITIRVIALAKNYNYQGVGCCLVILCLRRSTGGDITEDLVRIEQEFMNNIALTIHMASQLSDYSAGFSTPVRASIIIACQSCLELLVESPGFALPECFESSNQRLNLLLNTMKSIEPNGYHYIPLPNYDWCKYEVLADLRKYLKKNFDRSQIGQIIKQHNTEVRDLEQAALRKINKEKTDKYWMEHPDRPDELNAEIENIRQTIKQNESKINELNQQCKAAEAECDREPIPATAEKKKIQQQIGTLEGQQSALGFFQFSEKKQVKSDLKIAHAAYEQAQKDERIQKEQKREKKNSVVKEYQKKVDQIKKDNERLNKKLKSLQKELINPLGLDPL